MLCWTLQEPQPPNNTHFGPFSGHDPTRFEAISPQILGITTVDHLYRIHSGLGTLEKVSRSAFWRVMPENLRIATPKNIQTPQTDDIWWPWIICAHPSMDMGHPKLAPYPQQFQSQRSSFRHIPASRETANHPSVTASGGSIRDWHCWGLKSMTLAMLWKLRMERIMVMLGLVSYSFGFRIHIPAWQKQLWLVLKVTIDWKAERPCFGWRMMDKRSQLNQKIKLHEGHTP